MTEHKQSTGEEAISNLRKFHPVAFILAFGSMFLATYTLKSASPLEEKIIPFVLLLLISLAIVIYEVIRLNLLAEEKERNWRRRVFG